VEETLVLDEFLLDLFQLLLVLDLDDMLDLNRLLPAAAGADLAA